MRNYSLSELLRLEECHSLLETLVNSHADDRIQILELQRKIALFQQKRQEFYEAMNSAAQKEALWNELIERTSSQMAAELKRRNRDLQLAREKRELSDQNYSYAHLAQIELKFNAHIRSAHMVLELFRLVQSHAIALYQSESDGHLTTAREAEHHAHQIMNGTTYEPPPHPTHWSIEPLAFENVVLTGLMNITKEEKTALCHQLQKEISEQDFHIERFKYNLDKYTLKTKETMRTLHDCCADLNLYAKLAENAELNQTNQKKKNKAFTKKNLAVNEFIEASREISQFNAGGVILKELQLTKQELERSDLMKLLEQAM